MYGHSRRLSDIETAIGCFPICRTDSYSVCTRSGLTREYTVRRLPMPVGSYQLSNVNAY